MRVGSKDSLAEITAFVFEILELQYLLILLICRKKNIGLTACLSRHGGGRVGRGGPTAS